MSSDTTIITQTFFFFDLFAQDANLFIITLILSIILHIFAYFTSYYYFVKCNVLIIDLNDSTHTYSNDKIAKSKY